MLFSRTITGALLLGFVWMAGPVSAGDPPTAAEQYMLEVINRMRLNPDGEVYRLREMTWGDTGSPQPPDLNEGIASNYLIPRARATAGLQCHAHPVGIQLQPDAVGKQ